MSILEYILIGITIGLVALGVCVVIYCIHAASHGSN